MVASVRLLETRAFSSDAVQDPSEVGDFGASKELDIIIRVLKAGTAGTIELQHAVVNETSGFVQLATTVVNLNAAGSTYVQVTAFTRYVRWLVQGVAGGPVVRVDLVAKN
jgi:hypothetical protein